MSVIKKAFEMQYLYREEKNKRKNHHFNNR